MKKALMWVAMLVCAGTAFAQTPNGGYSSPSSGGSTTGAALGIYPTGHVTVSKNCGTQTNCFTVKADVNYVNDATWSAGANVTVTTGGTDPVYQCPGSVYPCSTGPSSATNDVGKTAFGTANCNGVSPQQCVTSIPQGTITSITSAHVAVLSSTAATSSANGSGLRFFAWGSIDTAQLQAAADAAYTSTSPTDVLLPCGNMFFDAVLFNPLRVTRSVYPVGFKGCGGLGSTELIPLPIFTCANAQTCFLLLNYVAGQTNNLGWADSAEDIHFTGLGLDLPQTAAFTGTAHTFIKGNSGNSFRNVTGVGYLWDRAVTNTDYGFECVGCKADEGVAFVFGNKPCHFQGGVAGGWVTTFDYGYCGGSLSTSVTIDGTFPDITTRNNEFNSTLTNDGSVNAAAVNVASGTTINWTSYHDQIGGIMYFTGGTSNLNDTLISPNSGGGTTEINVNNAAASVIFNHVNYTTASFTWLTQTAGNVYDVYPNFGFVSAGNPAIVTGGNYFAKGHSVTGACTGVGTAASTLALRISGTSTTGTGIPSTCTSTTLDAGQIIDTPGTLQFMNVTATAAGTNASSGVVTVLKNGATQTMTCTIGTGTSCHDSAHPIAVAAGDLISIQFTTQAADTLAGVKAFIPID